MFPKLLHSSAILLLLSVKLGVSGVANDADLAFNATALSEHARDIKDRPMKNTNASSTEIRDDAKIHPVISENTALSYDSTDRKLGLLEKSLSSIVPSYVRGVFADEEKPDKLDPQQSLAKNETPNDSMSKPATKIRDNSATAKTQGTTTLPTDASITPETAKSTSDISSSTMSAATSEPVSQSTLKSSTTPTTETTVTAETVTVTLPVENSTVEKTTQEPKVEPTEAKDPGMSSGIIALVMAIVFAVVVVIVYIGLLLWRRYLEFRYGNRELLVNDLEFDTNDLRHFEL